MSTQVETRHGARWDWRRLLVGYLGAVTGAAAVTPWAVGLVYVFLRHGVTAEFVGAGVASAIFWIFAFLTAWPLVAATYAIALRFKIRSVVYYVACGGMASIVLAPVYVHVLESLIPSDATKFELYLAHAPLIHAAGICGALVFWYLTGRHLGGREASDDIHQQETVNP